MKRTLPFFLLVLGLAIGLVLMSGCKKDEENPITPTTDNSDIPLDPGGVAPATTINNILPSATIAKIASNPNRVQINLLGILHPTTGLPITFTAGSTVFITEDTTLQGIKVTNIGSGTTLAADVVFVVDNSGSMSEEADSIASKIIAFANYLQATGLDVRVGCVGHGWSSDSRVYGAMDLTNAATLSAYLNRSTGLERTYGFTGADSARFATAAASFGNAGDENSIVGIYFADSLFSWRTNANRVYVAFTDEPTQPGGEATWATDTLVARWSHNRTLGTIHTVFSEDSTYYSWYALYDERPWELARGTGGTMKFIPSNAAGLDLTTLPVTGALASSSLIEFVTANPNVPHNVTITVKTSGADGKTVFQNITY